MTYCTRCLIPASKPHASFDAEGVCSACRAHERKNDVLAGIDWEDRRRQFDDVVAAAKARNAPFYDVVVPVSGGKDSISQVARVLPYDLRILAVNVDYGIKTEIGQHNLACIPRMGANLTIYRPQEPLHTRLVAARLRRLRRPRPAQPHAAARLPAARRDALRRAARGARARTRRPSTAAPRRSRRAPR